MSIEEYKRKIDILAKSNIKNGLKVVSKLLKDEFDNERIDKNQYLQLLQYIRGIEERENQEQNKINEKTKSEILKFKESLSLKVTPIYKGNLGQVAPKIKEDKEVDR